MKIKQLSETTAGAVASVAMPLGKTHKRTEEAANPAQQAAIAVNMKKAGKKPKDVKEGFSKDEITAAVKDYIKQGGEVVQGKKSKGPRKPGLSLASKHIGGGGDKMRPSRTGRGSNPLGKAIVAVEDESNYVEINPKSFLDDDFYAFDPETKVLKGTWSHKSVGRRHHEYEAQQKGYEVVSGMKAKHLGLVRKQKQVDEGGFDIPEIPRAPTPKPPADKNVKEGMFGLDEKTKAKIQNIAVEISDIPGYWDWERDTFTPYGILALEEALGDKKYVKYALSLTADDYYELEEDWQKVNRKDKTSGMSSKAVKAYRRENPGSKLKTAVTTKPSKLKRGSKAAKRRKSFCARMSGNKGPMKKPNGKPTPKALALRRWNCESIEDMRKLIENAEKFIAEHKQINNEEPLSENLHKWFKEKWVRFGPDGKIRGDCARGDDSEGKPKCLPQSKAQNLGKKGRASAAARKRREDPNPERSGKAINVNTKKKTNEEQIDELKCWDGYTRVRGVPAGAPGSCKKKTNEGHEMCPECGGAMYSEEMINEKKDACYYKVKSRYKVWPSAYASGALVKCRKKGAKNWGTKSESVDTKSNILKGMAEAKLREEELLLAPGQGIKFKTELMPKRTDHEVEMARNQLRSSFENAKHIYQNIKDLSEIQGLDGWVQAKITKASDYLEAVNQYLDGKKQMIEKEIEVEEQNQLQGTGYQQGNSVVQANPNAIQRDVQASAQLGGTLRNIDSLRQGGPNTFGYVDPKVGSMVGQMRTDQQDVNKRLAVAGVGQAPATPQPQQRPDFSQYKDDLEEQYPQYNPRGVPLKQAPAAPTNVPQGWQANTQADGSTRMSKQGSMSRDQYQQNMANYKAQNWTPQNIADYDRRMASGQGYSDAEKYANYQAGVKATGREDPETLAMLIPDENVRNQLQQPTNETDNDNSYMYTQRSYTNQDGDESFNRRTASIRPDSQGNTQVRAVDTGRALGDEMTINATIPKNVKINMVPQKGTANIEETGKLSPREKFKRGLKRAGYDPDAGADRLLKLIARQAEERREFERKQKEQDEEFYKNRKLKEQDPQPVDNKQQEQPKSNKLFDVLKSIGDVALPVGRAIYGMQNRDIPADVKGEIKTRLHNYVTGEPNK